MSVEKGWRPIPLSLKVLLVLLVLWSIGSVLGISARYELGLPFFGLYVYGIMAGLIVLLLDIVAPITFIFALWTRRSWAALFALAYMAIFSLNSIVALFTVREELGLVPILIPLLANVIFVVLIFRSRNYFK